TMNAHIEGLAFSSRHIVSAPERSAFARVAAWLSGFASGTYSAKLLAGTRQRFSGFNQPRQCGDVVLRILVTGKLPARGGGGMPQRIIISSRSVPALRITGAG